MVNEEEIHIEDEDDVNQEKENNADSDNIPVEFTEKFVIKKGKGTPLKDIPNVVSKLETKVFSFFTALHCILYGQNDEVEDYKKDVLHFSGFVLHDDEENQREKVKERLCRCTREMLAQLFSVFDICVGTAFYGMKKEKIIQLLLNFLEAPYDGSEEAESFHKEPFQMPSRKRKLETTEKLSSEMDTSSSLEAVHEEDKEESKEANNNVTSSEPEEMRGSEKEKKSTVPETPMDGGLNLSKDVPDMNEGTRGVASFELNSKSSSEKLMKSVWELEKSNKNQKFTESRVANGGDKPPKEWCDPSCEEVQNAISIILEKIDITTATFTDVLEELDEHFEMDMSPRKDAIKVMIEEGLYRLADNILELEDHEEN
ncbi:DEK domain-containing chromatin associated protein [Rhynchospora pubera]|nr:DEK domain-containing chromatin associated protein [Rhynchospora pubera]